MKKSILFLITNFLLLLSFFLGCSNNPPIEITTGSVKGSITIDGKTDNVLGLDVFIEGTSYISKVASDGSYEITNIPENSYYNICVQKGDFTKIIAENIEVKGGEVKEIEAIDILSAEIIPNTDYYHGYFDKENFIPQNFILRENQYSAGSRENNIDFTYEDVIPNINDEIFLEMEFTSDKDIDKLFFRFADVSDAANYWLELTAENEESSFTVEGIKAGETVRISNIFKLIAKPLGKIRLNISTKDKSFEEVTLTVLNSKMKVKSSPGIWNYVEQNGSKNSISCTATEEGIKFTGSLLSNVSYKEDDTSKNTTSSCVISIIDLVNNITMSRTYTLNSDTYENWEIIYPLVKKDNIYYFEVKVSHMSKTIDCEKFNIKAIGGIGEFRVENAETYEVTLREDKKTLSRTPQKFTDNPNVNNKIIDYGTKYAVYSCNDSATSIWDGIWRHDSVHWKSTTNQECDLSNLGWPSYDDLVSSLKGRRLGTRTETHVKLAGYTYNGTADFVLNDYKETFFDWDDEKEDKYFVLYKNPITSEYYKDVPGTSLYYIKEELDENGNVIFAKKDDAGAIEVYGQLICYGDKIYEPAYVPKTQIENQIFSGFWKAVCGDQVIDQMIFPFYSNDFWVNKGIVPVYLTPEYISIN